MRSNTGEQLRDILDILPRYETTAENKPILKARVEELEALLEECRLSLCPFDCKLLLLRIDTALAKKELSE